jgi:hypothetical protein
MYNIVLIGGKVNLIDLSFAYQGDQTTASDVRIAPICQTLSDISMDFQQLAKYNSPLKDSTWA